MDHDSVMEPRKACDDVDTEELEVDEMTSKVHKIIYLSHQQTVDFQKEEIKRDTNPENWGCFNKSRTRSDTSVL